MRLGSWKQEMSLEVEKIVNGMIKEMVDSIIIISTVAIVVSLLVYWR